MAEHDARSLRRRRRAGARVATGVVADAEMGRETPRPAGGFNGCFDAVGGGWARVDGWREWGF